MKFVLESYLQLLATIQGTQLAADGAIDVPASTFFVLNALQDAENLLVVAHGPLGYLPLSLLPTAPVELEPHAGALFSNHRKVPWLVRSHAVTMLPSVASLKTLRGLPPGKENRKAFAGFGDPLFRVNQMVAKPEKDTARAMTTRQAMKTGNQQEAEVLKNKAAKEEGRREVPINEFFDLAVRGPVSALRGVVVGGVDVNAKNDLGKTALMVASTRGKMAIVEYLVAAGADLDIRDSQGYTALHEAAFEGHVLIVRHLVDAGAEFDPNDGVSEGIFGMMGRREIVQILREAEQTPGAERKRKTEEVARLKAEAERKRKAARLKAESDRQRQLAALKKNLDEKLITQEQYVTSRGINIRGLPVRLRATPKTTELDSANLSRLPPLPDTADEVRSIAVALQADLTEDVFLGSRANERTLKALDLSGYKVVAFATHGLVPGDLDGLMQPALALSAPDVAGGKGDGLLTMGEIMGLKLDADWVVLSACNTGSGAGAGAEAVSGLGQAFFYAGTRALLVSNWPVETTSAKALTTGLFRRQAKDATLARAEALRRAMLAMIDEGGYVDPKTGEKVFSYAHPIFWAPFSLIGDGGGGKPAS
jgi:hypothetical protein